MTGLQKISKNQKTSVKVGNLLSDTKTIWHYFYGPPRGLLGKRLVNREDQRSGDNFPLVEMLHSCTPSTNKKNILSSFHYEDETIRVLVATVVFGVGVNCKDVHGIIQYYSKSKFVFQAQVQKAKP